MVDRTPQSRHRGPRSRGLRHRFLQRSGLHFPRRHHADCRQLPRGRRISHGLPPGGWRPRHALRTRAPHGHRRGPSEDPQAPAAASSLSGHRPGRIPRRRQRGRHHARSRQPHLAGSRRRHQRNHVPPPSPVPPVHGKSGGMDRAAQQIGHRRRPERLDDRRRHRLHISAEHDARSRGLPLHRQ